MTGHQINSLVGDLVAMAQAMERLPIAEQELAESRRLHGETLDTTARLEQRIINLKAEVEAKNEVIRSLEVAKDQAETMFLEADDRTSRALDFIKATFGNAGSLIQALETPRAEEPKAEPITDPVVVAALKPYMGSPNWTEEHGFATGQSEAGPIAQSESMSLHTVSSQSADAGEGVKPEQSVSELGPYHGLRYINVPGWISRDDWLAGGGTNEDYDWRDHNVA